MADKKDWFRQMAEENGERLSREFHMPTIRLEIEGMKHTIVKAMSRYDQELIDHIALEIDRQMRDFDLSAIVRRVLEDRVRASLTRYFTSGEGRHILEEAISAAFKGEIKDA